MFDCLGQRQCLFLCQERGGRYYTEDSRQQKPGTSCECSCSQRNCLLYSVVVKSNRNGCGHDTITGEDGLTRIPGKPLPSERLGSLFRRDELGKKYFG